MRADQLRFRRWVHPKKPAADRSTHRKSYRDTNLSDQFREWRNQAGLPQRCVFHGLRKAAARRLAEAGCTARKIAAITGHASLREVERYTRAVDQMRLAKIGEDGHGRKTGTQSVKPDRVKVSNQLK